MRTAGKRHTRLERESAAQVFHYVVRVRGKVYVWGSNDLGVALSVPLVLVVNNDAFGDSVDIASESPQGTPTTLGTLQPDPLPRLSGRMVNGHREIGEPAGAPDRVCRPFVSY